MKGKLPTILYLLVIATLLSPQWSRLSLAAAAGPAAQEVPPALVFTTNELNLVDASRLYRAFTLTTDSSHSASFGIPKRYLSDVQSILLSKNAPATANVDETITYALTISNPGGAITGSGYLTDTLPTGVEYAGGLTANIGTATYNIADRSIYWTNQKPESFISLQPQSRVASGSPRQVELGIADPVGFQRTIPFVPETISSAVNFALDDGSMENSIGLYEDESYADQFIWLNRFTPSADSFPMQLNQIQILFPGGQVPAGAPVDLVVYEDTDHDPANGATWLATIPVTAQYVDDIHWSEYNLPAPIVLTGPGDVLIGAINRFVQSGVTPVNYPAAIDTTASQGRSWIGWWQTDPPDPAILPPDDTFGLIDTLLPTNPGNWLIRGSGTTLSPETIVIRFRAKVTGYGLIENRADLNYDGDLYMAKAQTYVDSADLSIVITTTGEAKTGETLEYQTVATNHGPGEATSVVVKDTLPEGVSFISASAGCVLGGGVVTCNLASLSIEASRTYTISVTMPETVGTVTNAATVAGVEPDPNQTNNTASIDTLVRSAQVDLYLPAIMKP